MPIGFKASHSDKIKSQIEPKKWNSLLKDKNIKIIDTRKPFEYEVGTFKGAEKPNIKKTSKFFQDLNIKNLKIYFDPEFELTKQFKLRGVPTTILLNKEGNEFARIIGDINFEDKKFIEWINNFI